MTLSDRNESKSHIFSLRNWACPEDLAQQDSTAVIEAEELLAILPYIRLGHYRVEYREYRWSA